MILVFTPVIQSSEVACILSTRRDYFKGSGISCNLEKSLVLSENGTKLINVKNENVTEFIGENISGLEDLPEDIGEVFKNLDLFRLVNSSLKSINKKNFRGMLKVTYMNLEENSIELIDADTFDDMESLLTLKLEENKISSLHPDTFSKLYKIEYIHLDGNQLTTLDPDTFKHNKKLVYLTVNENKLTSLDVNLFDSLTNLKLFRVIDNEISSLHSELLRKPIGLEAAYFSKNKISEIPVELFSSLTFLEEVDFADNPLELIDFALFKDNKRINLVSFDGVEIKKILNIEEIDNLNQLKSIQFTKSGDSCVKNLYNLIEREKLKQDVTENCVTN